MKKGFMDISFSWIFAIIVGGIIIFGAIYGVSKFSKIQETKTSAVSAATLGALLNPLETGVEAGKSIYIKMPVESKIRNKCDSYGTFGRQGISVEEFLKNKWTASNINVYFENKYIFSNDEIEGRGFYAFSKPFEFPFKVADLIYLTSEDEVYCFSGAPNKIELELTNLNQENIVANQACSETDTKVCFGAVSGCDIVVEYTGKRIRKGTEEYYFIDDATMYAAIFSDKETYNCQLTRVMKRLQMLTKLYEEKALLVQNAGCVSPALTYLGELRMMLDDFKSDKQLKDIYSKVQEVNSKNAARCKLW